MSGFSDITSGNVSGWENDLVNGISDPSKALSGWDPSQGMKNKSQITAPTAPPQVQGPAAAPNAYQMQVPVQGPNGTYIARTPQMQAAQINQTGGLNQYADQSQRAQSQLMGQLANQAAGRGPSVAQTQLQQGQQANTAATMAALASSRGQANPLAQRSAMEQQAAGNAQLNQQAALARIQEQQAAQQTLAGVAGQSANQGLTARGQDIGVNTNQAGLNQQANAANYGGGLQTNLAQAGINANNASQLFGAQQNAGLANMQSGNTNNALIGQYANMGQQAQMANQNAALGYGNQNLQAQMGNAGIAQQNIQNTSNIAGGLLNGGAGVLSGMASGGTGLFAAAAHGMLVPGEANVPGDSSANDTVKAKLSPGEIVVPRTAATSPEAALAFIASVKGWDKKPDQQIDQTHNHAIAALATAQGLLHKRLAQLEARKGA